MAAVSRFSAAMSERTALQAAWSLALKDGTGRGGRLKSLLERAAIRPATKRRAALCNDFDHLILD